MLKRITALAVILALSILLAACGGADDNSAGDEAPQTPAPTQVATAAPAPAASAAGDAASTAPADLPGLLLDKTMRLWDIYNTYDVEGLAVLYEASYWQEQEEEVRSNMQPFKTLGITFTPQETSTPTEIAPGKWEIKQNVTFSGGSVKMLFIYEEFDGEWLLTYAESQ